MNLKTRYTSDFDTRRIAHDYEEGFSKQELSRKYNLSIYKTDIVLNYIKEKEPALVEKRGYNKAGSLYSRKTPIVAVVIDPIVVVPKIVVAPKIVVVPKVKGSVKMVKQDDIKLDKLEDYEDYHAIRITELVKLIQAGKITIK